MVRTPAARRRVDVLSSATRRWREVLLGKQDLPKSATAPDRSRKPGMIAKQDRT